jgi:hypothetical protein
MKPYTVIYEEPSIPGWQFFECLADDGEHAEEQCFNANPTAIVLWVNIGHGTASQTMESMKVE